MFHRPARVALWRTDEGCSSGSQGMTDATYCYYLDRVGYELIAGYEVK